MDPETFIRAFTGLCDRLAGLGEDWVHEEPPTAEDLDRLEHALAGRLPPSYRAFLLAYGGGSFPSWHFRLCQVRRGDPLAEEDGQVFGQTLRNRAEYGMPLGRVVIEQQARDLRGAEPVSDRASW